MPLPERKYPRADWHNYHSGVYMITACTSRKSWYFGFLNNGNVYLNSLGKILNKFLSETHLHYPDIEIPDWIVMPNHFHAIIIIDNDIPAPEGTIHTCHESRKRVPTLKTNKRERLSVVVGAIKAAVTRYANRNGIDFSWQPRFYDTILTT